jgi:hypothetical protein
MHTTASAILAMVMVSAAAPAQAQTYDPRYPVCLQVYGRINYISCGYRSMAQCRLSAEARAAQCIVNPFYGRAQRGRKWREYQARP